MIIYYNLSIGCLSLVIIISCVLFFKELPLLYEYDLVAIDIDPISWRDHMSEFLLCWND